MLGNETAGAGMIFLRLALAYAASAAVAVVAASAFISQRIIAEQSAVGGAYTAAQQIEAFLLNLPGLAAGGYGVALAVALLVAFAVAALLKRVLKPLSAIAYPIAGAAAALGVLWLINTYLAPPGVGGAIPGARSGFELALQALAGAIGGLAFELLRPRARAA
jgi:hypothetical protein